MILHNSKLFIFGEGNHTNVGKDTQFELTNLASFLSSLMMLDPFTNGHHMSKVKVKEQREEDPILSSYWHFGVNEK
jgi:hypothetical protein